MRAPGGYAFRLWSGLGPEVPVPAAVRAVIVFKQALISLPVTLVELTSVMTRCDPASAAVRRSSPVTVMPFVMVSHGIPITIDVHVAGAGTSRHNSNHTGGRWRANSDSNVLSGEYRNASQ